MTAEPESIPRICDTCHATDDREPICNRGSEDAPYYLCIDRAACADRAQRQQHEAVEKIRAAEQAALEAEPEGKHAATGPLQAITDAAVAEMTEAAKDAPADGEASDD